MPKLRLGFMGRLDVIKGIEPLLECLEDLNDPRIELDIAGRGSAQYESGLRSRFARPGFNFLGFASPQQFYPQIDALIMPSVWHEPQGRVMVDAFGYGVPVIGARRGGITEFIRHGETGYLYEPLNQGELRNIIVFLADHPETLNRIRSNIRKQVRGQTNSLVCTQYLELFQAL